jgi:hypothetical protein
MTPSRASHAPTGFSPFLWERGLPAIDCAAVTQSFAMKKEPDMESPTHSLPNLFKQLGLPDDAESIDKFIATHSPLKPELHLADAFFWSESQAQFLRDDILDDADWAEVVDQLDVLLRKGRGV